MFSAQLELGHRLMLRRNPFRPFLADLIEARVRLGERRHIKVCEGSIASVAGVTMVDRALAQRWQWMGNYAVALDEPIAVSMPFAEDVDWVVELSGFDCQ